MEAKAWQAFYATLLLERSKFGLNELLGPNGRPLLGRRSGHVLAVRAAGPAARPPHALSHLIDTDLDATFPGRFLLWRGDPADPLVSRQRGDIGPETGGGDIKLYGLSEICRQLVNRAVSELLSVHGCVYWGLTPELSRLA